MAGVGGEKRGVRATVGGVTEDKGRVPRRKWASGQILSVSWIGQVQDIGDLMQS